MKNTIYKLSILLFLFGIVISCQSPEAVSNYTPAKYELPSAISINSTNVKSDSFDVTFNNSGSGEGYYVVVEGGSDEPSNNDVFDGNASGLIESGKFSLTGSEVTIHISDLCNNATYDIYAVQLTSDGFLSESTTKTSVTTNSLDISGTYTAIPYAFGEAATQYTATLTLIDGTTNQYTIDSAWGPNFVSWVTGDSGYDGLYVYSATITINSDNTISVVGDDGWAIGGTGNFDSSCKNTFSYNIDQTLFGPGSFTVDVELTQDQE
jgi:hypothetical protein